MLYHVLQLKKGWRNCELIRLESVEHISIGDVTEEVMEHLSKFEQELVKRLSRFDTRGKRGRRVPILLTSLMRHAVEAISDPCNRHLMGFFHENPYLFAIPNTEMSKFRINIVLPAYTEKCGASDPSLLRSTKLQKHLAIMTQLENLTENDLDIVASFMGHDIHIHRKYYRLPQTALELSKMGQLITTAG